MEPRQPKFEVYHYDASPMLDEMCQAAGYESWADLQAKAEAERATWPPAVREAVEQADRELMDRVLFGTSYRDADGKRIDPGDVRPA